MKPTEQDKELREKLLNLRITVWKQTNLNGQANLDHDSVDELVTLITQYGDTREREGRIDEAKAMYDRGQFMREPVVLPAKMVYTLGENREAALRTKGGSK